MVIGVPGAGGRPVPSLVALEWREDIVPATTPNLKMAAELVWGTVKKQEDVHYEGVQQVTFTRMMNCAVSVTGSITEL